MPLWLCHHELPPEHKLGYVPRQSNPSDPSEPSERRSPPGLQLHSRLPAASAAPPRKSQPQMKPYGRRRRQNVCQGSPGGSASLCSLKQRGPARCKLVLSPLSLLAAALSLSVSSCWRCCCSRPALALVPRSSWGTSRDSRVPKASRVPS